MKTLLLLALLFFPMLLFAQDTTEPETFTAEFDNRCTADLVFGAYLISARLTSTTLDVVMLDIQQQAKYGSLRNYSPEIISYMIDVVLVVYNTEDVSTAQGSYEAMRAVESLCILTRDAPTANKKLST